MFDLQPQSSSLSPNSKTRFYQEKLDKAHEIIDFLEVLLYERRIHQTSYKNVEIPTLQLNKKFIDIIDKKSSSYVTTPLQYSTPRDRRTILSLGDQTSARFVEEIKSRHGEQRNKELNDQIQELKSELIFCQKKQSITKKENKQTKLKFIQMQLLLPQENEINIQTKIKEINQTNKILQKEENKKVQQHNQNSEKQLKEESTKPQFQQNFQDNNSHKKLFGSLQKEIQQLKIKSQNFTIIKQLLNLKEKQIQCIEYQYNDIYNVVNDVQQNQNIVMASESCFNEYIYRRRYQFYQIFQIQKKSKEQEL